MTTIGEWFKNNWAQVLVFVVVLALYLLLGLLLWWLLQRYVDPSAIKDPSKEAAAKKDLLQALGLIMAGVAGAIGIFFTWRGQRLAREAQEDNQRNTLEQLEQSRNELDIALRGQITERFTRAIEQLGSDSLQIRLGGIHSLERIDKDSPGREYYATVMEVLTAYVRENLRPELTVIQEQHGQPRRILPTDVRTILDVLMRREEDGVPQANRRQLDLREVDLRGAFLEGVDLRGADLWRAILEGAYLQDAILQDADLEAAYFRHADLRGACLQRAQCLMTEFSRAYLTHADLRGANLKQALLNGAYLGAADLRGTNIELASFQGAGRLTREQIDGTIGSNMAMDLPEHLHPAEG